MSIQIGQFDELAVRHNAALAAFKTMHEARHPLPVKEQIARDVVSLIIVLALAVVMVAAVIVSSSRTIEEFGGGTIGLTAFVMIEGGIMAYAFFRARRNASEDRLAKTVRWATVGLILTFIVGLGANTDASLRHQGIILPQWINIVIHLLVAVSAPTLAFISSDVLAIELMATDIKRRKAEDNHRIALDEWWVGFNRTWAAQQKNWGVRVDLEQPRQIAAEVSSDFTKFHEKSVKPRIKIGEIAAQIKANGDSDLPVNEMMDKYQISMGSTTKIREIIRSERQADE